MNPWDELSHSFNTHKDASEIDVGAADNIFIAWPALFDGITRVQPKGHGLTALDFGCGSGSFAAALQSRGYQVDASDTSPKMIDTAQAHLGKAMSFQVANSKEVHTFRGVPFSLITSVMVFQFIRDIEAALDDLDTALCPNGVMAFAVFNPDFIQANCGENKLFINADVDDQGTLLRMVIENTSIPVYPRTAQDYHVLLKRRGYSRVICKKPKFTREFLAQYPMQDDTRFSEYIVMVYQKQRP